eukprot:gene5099-7108_t
MIPTFSPYPFSSVQYSTSVRTTTCDILCTTNTSREFEPSKVPLKFKALDVSLPYERLAVPDLSRGATKNQNYKLVEIRQKKSSELLKDRIKFFENLIIDKKFKEDIRNKAVIKIQSLFRGYQKRPGRATYKPKKKKISVLSQLDILDELCDMAVILKLKPIDGLNLEARSKASKRKNRIDNAAAFRIQRFFQMITAKRRAQVIVTLKRQEKIDRAARRITKAVRFMKTKNFLRNMDSVRRNNMAGDLQSQYRKYVAKQKVKKMFTNKLTSRRQNDAVIVIQRNIPKRKRIGAVPAAKAAVKLTFDNIISDLLDFAVDECQMEAILIAIEIENEKIRNDLLEMEKQIKVVENDDHNNSYDDADFDEYENENDLHPPEEDSNIPTPVPLPIPEPQLDEDDHDDDKQYLEEFHDDEDNTIIPTEPQDNPINDDEMKPEEDDKNILIDELSENIIKKITFELVENVTSCAIEQILPFIAYGLAARSDSESVISSMVSFSEDSGIVGFNLGTSVSQFVNKMMDQAIELARAKSPELINPIDSNELLVNDDMMDEKMDENKDNEVLADVPKMEDINEQFTSDKENLSFNLNSKTLIEEKLNEALIKQNNANYAESNGLLDQCHSIMDELPLSAKNNREYLLLLSNIDLISANNCYQQAYYNDAKLLYDSVYEKRSILFDENSFYLVEVKYYLSEYYRTLALFNEAGVILSQYGRLPTLVGFSPTPSIFYWSPSISNLTPTYCIKSRRSSFNLFALSEVEDLLEKIKINSISNENQHDIYNLHSNILIGFIDLYYITGQYYKSHEYINRTQERLKQNKGIGISNFDTQCRFVSSLILSLEMKGKYGVSLTMYQELLEKRKQILHNKHPLVAKVLNNITNLLIIKGDFEQAIELAEESLLINREIYPNNHPHIAETLHNLGLIYSIQGDFNKSDLFFKQSLTIRETLFHSNHYLIADSLNGLGELYTLYGYPVIGLNYHQNAYKIRQELFVIELHRDRNHSLFNLGINALARGSILEGIHHMKRCLELRELLLPLFGNDIEIHADNELTKLHLAHANLKLFCNSGNNKELLKNSIKNLRALLGSKCIYVAMGISFLGINCRNKGNYADANTLFTSSMSMMHEITTDSHPITISIMIESSTNYRIPGFYKDAYNLCELSLKICNENMKNIPIGDNILLLTSQLLYAQIECDNNKYSSSEKKHLLIINKLLPIVGETSALYATALSSLGECYRLQQNYDKSIQCFTEAIKLFKITTGENSFEVIECITHFAILLIDMQNFEQSHNVLITNVIPALEETLTTNHPLTMYAKANLSMCMTNSSVDNTSIISDDHSISSFSLYNTNEVKEFLDYCRKISFSMSHPWVQRFSKLLDGSQVIEDEKSIGSSDEKSSVGYMKKTKSFDNEVMSYEPSTSVYSRDDSIHSGSFVSIDRPISAENSSRNGHSVGTRSYLDNNSGQYDHDDDFYDDQDIHSLSESVPSRFINPRGHTPLDESILYDDGNNSLNSWGESDTHGYYSQTMDGRSIAEDSIGFSDYDSQTNYPDPDDDLQRRDPDGRSYYDDMSEDRMNDFSSQTPRDPFSGDEKSTSLSKDQTGGNSYSTSYKSRHTVNHNDDYVSGSSVESRKNDTNSSINHYSSQDISFDGNNI